MTHKLEALADERRRKAITEWWERQTLRDFIVRKRRALASQGDKE